MSRISNITGVGARGEEGSGIFLGIGARFGGEGSTFILCSSFYRLAEIAFLIATGLQRILVGWKGLLVNGSAASIFPQEVLTTVSGRRRI